MPPNKKDRRRGRGEFCSDSSLHGQLQIYVANTNKLLSLEISA
jgi:hypothetical protein